MISALLGLIPFPYRLLALFAGAVIAVASLIGYGAHQQKQRDTSAGQAAQIQQAARIAKDQHARQAITTSIDTQYAARTERQRVVYRTINKEVIRYVSRPDNAACSLDNRWLRIHDAAATGLPFPADSSSEPDATASGFTSDDAIAAVASNYESCRESTERLRGLQEWVRLQVQMGNSPKSTQAPP